MYFFNNWSTPRCV